MKNKKLKTCALLMFCIGLLPLSATVNIQVHPKTGVNTSYELTNIKNLTFGSGNLTITMKDASVNNFALTTIGFLNFPNVISAIPENQVNTNLSMFPNPVKDMLYFVFPSSTKQSVQLEILGLDGKVLIKTLLNDVQNGVSVSNLQQGVYLCRLQNGTKTEMSKFIKQ